MTRSVRLSHSPPRPEYLRKIVGVDELDAIVADLRRDDAAAAGSPRTVVQCHGCFDLVHPGHIRYLQFARQQGDVLVVSITGDAAMDKGAQRPYIPQELRAENLAALELVDYVVIDDGASACALLARIRPDIYVKGQEYATNQHPGFLAERAIVESHGGRVIFSSGQVVFSSSRLIETMPQADDLDARRLELTCRRHAIDRRSVRSLLRAMRGKRVLVLGDVTVERYVTCDATDIAGESPMMSLAELDRRDYPGGAAFLAAGAAALGAEVVLVTAVGANGGSQWLLDALEARGVRVHPLRNRPSVATRRRYLVDEHKMFEVSRAAHCPLDSVREQEAASIVRDEAGRADAAILYDGGYGAVTPGLMQRLGPVFRDAIPILCGGPAEPRGEAGTLGPLDLVCLTERQLRAGAGDPDAGLSTLAYGLLQSTQSTQLIVALGKRGLVTFDRRSHDRRSPAWNDRLFSEYLSTLPRRAVDRLGGTESMLTGATLALAAGANLMQAAYVGAAAATIQVGRLGLRPVESGELSDWFDGRAELLASHEDEATPDEIIAAVLSDSHVSRVA